LLLIGGLIEVEGILEVEGPMEVEAEVEGPVMVQKLLEKLKGLVVVVVERMVLTVLQKVVVMLGFEVVGEQPLFGLIIAFLLIKY